MANQNFRVKNGLEVGSVEIANSSGIVNAAAIANSGVTAGTVGNTTAIPVITVDSRGFITNLQSASVSGVSGFTWDANTDTLTVSTADGSSYSANISGEYASAAQGTLADSAVQPNDNPTFGSVTVTGTVDGRDVAADGTKLDGIEASADVTDATNVTAAGALMDSEVTNLAAVKAFDPADYATAAQGTLADSALQSETTTALALANNTLTFTDETGANTNIDLSAYLDEDSRAIASGVLHAANGIATFTRDDETTFNLDLSALLDDTNLVTSVNTKAGVVTLDADDISDTTTTNKFTTASDISKLAGIETAATADQTGAEIKAAYEAEANTNAYTDAEKTKLAGIEASADVTDATNVEAAGALMDSEVTNLAQVKAFDSADYATAAQGNTADAALPKTGGAMTGAITTNSTFDGRDVATDGAKLDGIETGATADQTGSEIKTAYEAEADTNAFDDAAVTKLAGIEASADVTDATNVEAAGALMDSEVTNLAQVKAFDSSDYATAAQGTKADSAQQPPSEGAFVNGDKTKLDAIEASATADQTGAEIKALYEAEADTNAFTDDLLTKLSNIEANATADQTGAEIKALYEAEASAFTDALFTKLSGIETAATADQTGAQIKSAYEAEANTNAYTDAEKTKLAGIEASATADQTITSGAGLTGGGTGNLTLNVGAGVGITVNADDIAVNAQTGLQANSTGLYTDDSQIVHDDLSGFVGNEHIDHTTVSITAGNGLTGGGTIAATRSLAVGAGTGVTVNSTAVSIGQAVATTSDVTFNNVDVDGDLRDGSNRVLKVYDSAGALVWG